MKSLQGILIRNINLVIFPKNTDNTNRVEWGFMKKVLIGCLLLLSAPTFANEYVKNIANCKITGDSTTFSLVNNISLPHQIDFTIEMSGISGNRKYEKIEVIGTDILKVEKIKKDRYGEDEIQFESLTADESEALLSELGATNIPRLPRGFRFDRLDISKYINHDRAKEDETRSQIHFPLDKMDGLSYHVNINCYIRWSDHKY